MNKEPLSRTNVHLRDPKKRREMIVRWAIASSAIEEVHKAAESALLPTKRPVHIRADDDPPIRESDLFADAVKFGVPANSAELRDDKLAAGVGLVKHGELLQKR